MFEKCSTFVYNSCYENFNPICATVDLLSTDILTVPDSYNKELDLIQFSVFSTTYR